MTKPAESVHDRLNRELYRYYLGGWKVWAATLPVLLLLLWALTPQPRDVSYRTGVVTGVSTLIGEAGPIIRIGVDTNGVRVEAGTRARLITPAQGETICLSHTRGRWTGAESFQLTDMRFCQAANTTQPVD